MALFVEVHCSAGAPPAPSISFRLLGNNGFTEQEVALMTNLQPMTPDEAFKLIPSLDVRAGHCAQLKYLAA